MEHAYDPTGRRPLAGYAVMTGAFGALMGGALVAARAAGRPIDRPAIADVALAALATQKVSRVIAKDKITSFVRAPFTRFEETTGYGEVSEQPRGDGLRLATGELVECPYCLSQWVAAAFALGWVTAPGLTRLLTAMWSAQAVADAMQIGISAAQEAA